MRLDRLAPSAALAALLLLAACTGAEPKHLTGQYVYPERICAEFAECTIPTVGVNVDPLATPGFALVAGTLPEGLVLDPVTGAVHGVAAAPVDTFVGVDVTADHYLGTLHSSAHVVVEPLVMWLAFAFAPVNGFPTGVAMPDLRPIFRLQSVDVLETLGQAVGVTYSLEPGSTLPPGVTFDEATGRISGTPSGAGTFTGSVRAHLTYLGRTLDFSEAYSLPVT